MQWILRDADHTEQIGAALAQGLRPGDFIGLIGDLGAGKTCLTRGLMAGLWSVRGQGTPSEAVTSPTYTLLNLYPAPTPFEEVLHADLYRLEDADDLASTGYWDAVESAELSVVEWVDRIPDAWPGPGIEITLSHRDAQRALTLSWRDLTGRRITAHPRVMDMKPLLDAVAPKP